MPDLENESRANQVKALEHRRRIIVEKFERFKVNFEKIDKNNIDDSICSILKSRLEKLEPLWHEYDEIQGDIELLIPENDENSKQREMFESLYFPLVGSVKSVVKKFDSDNENLSVSGSGNSSARQIALQACVKLPPIKIPMFDGNYSNWMEFKEIFIALVDTNNLLTCIQKFYYLRNSLEREPLELIKSLEVSADNYSTAWGLLSDRYENKKILIHNHIKAIFEYTPILKESYVELRKLYDQVSKHLRALNTLGENTDSWDRLVLYIVSNKFDFVTKREWESYKYAKDLPTMSDLNNFLKEKCDILEKLEITGKSKGIRTPKGNYNFPSTDLKCFYCQKEHLLYVCETFLKLNQNERINEVKRLKLCINCLKPGHPFFKCKAPRCFQCKKAHNSLLHISQNTGARNCGHNESAATGRHENGAPTPLPQQQRSNGGASDAIHDVSVAGTISTAVSASSHVSGADSVADSSTISQVLLSTAVIKIKGNNNTVTTCRALLDSGSQSSFLTERLCKRLNLRLNEVNHIIKGVGQTLSNISKQVDVTIESCTSGFSTNLQCLVLPKITESSPLMSFNKNVLKIPQNFVMADPNYNVNGEIDCLLGSSIFWSILCPEQERLGPNCPVLQNTQLGWVIAGKLLLNSLSKKLNSSVACLNVNNSVLNETLIKFWQMEEVNNEKPMLSDSEKYCQNYFKESTQRDSSGRFIVKIPFKNSLEKLGHSQEIAVKRFKSCENKLNKNNELKKEYHKFMQEYIDLGHMREVSNNSEVKDGYYMPHHAIIKSSSVTTKCRVVFDASAKTDTGLSLNDVQFSGPSLQRDIFTILINFRQYKFVMTADVSKLYRQILIHDDDKKYHKIVWRFDSEDELRYYELQTVTYGTASAPYLAVRCLLQLAYDNKEKFPVATKVIKNNFYMDDCLAGADSEKELLEIQNEITTILKSGGFELRKWLCNNLETLKKFNVNNNLDVSILNIGENEQNKTLGVVWDSKKDIFGYSFNNILVPNEISKRCILSIICQLFDPLGLLGPILTVSKLLMQSLWKLKIHWDDPVPNNIKNVFLEFVNGFSIINEIKIPRHAIISEYVIIEVHGFSDSSEKAYGACVYLRCITTFGKIVVNILCAKSRVAPIKQLSLPRLELCGAVLLANLVKRVGMSLDLKLYKQYFWMDSTITLAWIRGDITKWKTFVANRVSEIQSLTNISDWNHVTSRDNPADLLSRGCSPQVLKDSKIWWHGPEFLFEDSSKWALQENITNSDIPEQRTCVNLVTKMVSNDLTNNLLKRFSSFKKIVRVFAFVLRFINNCKIEKAKRKVEFLRPADIDIATKTLIKHVQLECFPTDYDYLLKGRPLKKNSQILSLNPFLSNDGVIRVGGRIRFSNEDFNKIHPIILPKSHILTTLILRTEHEHLLHCGAQQLLYAIREKYWPISGRANTKNIIKKCVVCFKAKPSNSPYLMGDLPEVRVNVYSPFLNVGIDYGGFFLLKDRKTRNPKLIKAYVCLFVCMSTKAVHLELVSDLTTDAFIATLKRFIARRGKPANIYSDNGLNFVGANNEISKLYDMLKVNSDFIARELANDRICWHFIPARSPNFGGIWEAGIKSTKHHLKRVCGYNSYTYEDFSSILTQIEGILNSRPLCPLSSNPEDLTVLTPAHFLVGRSLTALPDPSYVEVPENRLSRFQKLQAAVQHFWKRWQNEYLSELQCRTKWKQHTFKNIKVGSMVLIKNDSAPVLNWQLGRIVGLYPGRDLITRVVDIKVRDCIVRRSLNKVCALPMDE